MQVEHTLDQAIIVQVAAAVAIVPAAEVKQEISLGPDVVPGFVRHGPEHERAEPLGRLSLADINDTAVVHLQVSRAVRIPVAVEPAADTEGKMKPGEENSPVVLP